VAAAAAVGAIFVGVALHAQSLAENRELRRTELKDAAARALLEPIITLDRYRSSLPRKAASSRDRLEEQLVRARIGLFQVARFVPRGTTVCLQRQIGAFYTLVKQWIDDPDALKDKPLDGLSRCQFNVIQDTVTEAIYGATMSDETPQCGKEPIAAQIAKFSCAT